MEKRDLRPLVIDSLRREPSTQYNTIHTNVDREAPDFNISTDVLPVREIIWEFLIQGIIAPGMNSSNLDFPFVHVTDYGISCLGAGNILPHDPDGYIERLIEIIESEIDEIVLTYVVESLQTFLGGHYLASAVMLGVSSERLIDILIDSFLTSLDDPDAKAKFERSLSKAGRSVKRRFDAIRKELLSMKLPPEIADALDIQISGVFTLIRYGRNDAGHPTGSEVDRDVVHGNLLLFPGYCQRVYGLLDYFGKATKLEGV
jgi:hypothetical protein